MTTSCCAMNRFFLLSPLVESLPLSGPVAPSEAATWHLDLGITGVLYRRYQVYYKGEKLGADMAVIAVELPEAMVEKRQQLEEDVQELIDEWKAKREVQKLENRAKSAEDYFGAAMVVASAAVDEARVAALEAMEARRTADEASARQA